MTPDLERRETFARIRAACSDEHGLGEASALDRHARVVTETVLAFRRQNPLDQVLAARAHRVRTEGDRA